MHGLVLSARGVKGFYKKNSGPWRSGNPFGGGDASAKGFEGGERVLFVQHGPNPDGGVMDWYHSFLRPLLFCLPAEAAHNLALMGLRTTPRLVLKGAFGPAPHDPVRIFGLNFPNRVGLGAGMDHDLTVTGLIGGRNDIMRHSGRTHQHAAVTLGVAWATRTLWPEREAVKRTTLEN
jgi:hypothetical protein